MLPKIVNYSKKYIPHYLAVGYGVYLNYNFYTIVDEDYKKLQNNK